MQSTPCFNNIMAGREADRSQKSQQLPLQFMPGQQTQSHRPGSQGGRAPPVPAHSTCLLALRAGETVLVAISPLMLTVELVLRFKENIVIFLLVLLIIYF